MRRVLMTALTAAAAIAISTPALATVTNVAASSVQGTLVHGTNTEQTATTVTGNLGQNGPNIVNFDADTNGPGDLVRLQDGSGQADVTGAEITLGGTPNDTYDMLSGNIYLTNHDPMQDIEFGFTSGAAGTVDFIITALSGTYNFDNLAIGEGDTFFAFLASVGDGITNVHWSVDTPPGEIQIIKQVRIDLQGQFNSGVPEPATWGMMLLGFAGIGMALRRSRRRTGALMQIA
jgi:hypothetical protein